jgi:hypothetical protein
MENLAFRSTKKMSGDARASRRKIPADTAVADWKDKRDGSLLEQMPVARSKNLVFTSAGGNNNVTAWLGANRDFDLYASYYGDYLGHLSDEADYHSCLKACKFPALKTLKKKSGDLINRYKSIFVLDDDLICSADCISRLFQVRHRSKLLLLQPAFSQLGKISHEITACKPFSK